MNHSRPHTITKNAAPMLRAIPPRRQADATMSAAPSVARIGAYHGAKRDFNWNWTTYIAGPMRNSAIPARNRGQRRGWDADSAGAGSMWDMAHSEEGDAMNFALSGDLDASYRS